MSCVSDSQLLSFFTGALPAAQRASVLEHLEGCESCRLVVATLGGEGRPPASAPERVGLYRLIKLLGRGGMGEVFLAEDEDGQRCVVKRLLAELGDDPDLQRRFRREAQVLARLSHPNIGRLLEFGEDEGTCYLALEFIEGVDFRTLLRRFKDSGSIAPAALAVELVRQAASGLAAAHRATDSRGKPLKLIHRDVSPGNLMVSCEGVVKVIDFGMAQSAMHEASKTGVVLGKLQYFSPEQARGDRIDARCDVFGLGLVFQEFLTGRRSYAGSRPRELERDVSAGRTPAEPPADVWVMAELWEISRRCVAPDPKDRFTTMDALEHALAAVQRARSLTLPAEAIRALTG
ncbi:MAG: Serine/threonine protein kinase [Myxococcaceae bacterium]|nr:Serine/threonine protein kinase [Myxococcaceae bacterium]